MSRSYKHNPIYTDGSPHSTQRSKHFANSKVRSYQDEEVPLKSRSWFKKVFESYDIHDYILRWTWEEAKEYCKKEWIEEEHKYKEGCYPENSYHKKYTTLENYIKHFKKSWYKDHKRK